MKLLTCLVCIPLAVLAAAAPKADHTVPGANVANSPLPDKAQGPGVRFVDLNGDGYDDLIVSNAQGYGVYLYNPVEKKNVQWNLGWTNVLREGVAGDANSIPLIARADGRDNDVSFKDGAMRVRTEDWVRIIPFSELLKVPGPAPKSPKESLAALHLKPGFSATLVASEPLVQDPVFVDWDSKGRMWVVEMGDYPFAPGETTKDGKVGQGKVSKLQTGRIKILEDTNGDGIYDKAASLSPASRTSSMPRTPMATASATKRKCGSPDSRQAIRSIWSMASNGAWMAGSTARMARAAATSPA